MIVTAQQSTKRPSKIIYHRGPPKAQHKGKEKRRTWEVPAKRGLWKIGVSSIYRSSSSCFSSSFSSLPTVQHPPSYALFTQQVLPPSSCSRLPPRPSVSSRGADTYTPASAGRAKGDLASNWSSVESQLLPQTSAWCEPQPPSFDRQLAIVLQRG